MLGSLWRLMVAVAAVLATGAAAMPAHAAAPGPGHTNWVAGKASVHVMRPVGSTAPPSAAAPARVVRDVTNGSGQLTYGAGPVQTQPELFLDFWGSDFNTDTDAGGFTGAQAAMYVELFLNESARMFWMFSQTQYCQAGMVAMPPNATISSCGNNSHAGTPGLVLAAQTWNDTTTVAPSQPNVAAIAAEADAARVHFGIGQKDVNATVIVFSPTGKSTFSDPNIGPFCAFHSFTATTVFAYIPWLPDQGASCHTNEVNATNGPLGQGHFDGFSISTGHEIAGVITDPQPGAPDQAGHPTFGWQDAAGLETGDKCAGLTTWPEQDQTFSSGGPFFAVQPLWSDAGASCAWQDLGGVISGHAAISARDATHLDVFARGTDGQVYWRTSDTDAWSGWISLGGFIVGSPAAVSWDSNRIDLFVRGGDNQLWHKSWTPAGWSPNWDGLGGFITASPTAASWGPNRLDVFVRGGDGALWHKSWNGANWSGYDGRGGFFNADPAAVSWGLNRIDVFVRGGDNAVWHQSWNGSMWSGFDSRGGGFITGLGASSTASNQVTVYGIGGDNKLYQMAWNGSAWVGWTSLDGGWPVDPAAVAPPGTGTRLVNFAMIGNTTQSVERLVRGNI